MTATRTRSTFAAAAGLVLLLTGCASSTESTDDGSATSGSESTEESAESTAENTDESAEPMTEGSEESDDSAGAAVAVPAAMDFTAATVEGGDLDVAALAGEPTVFWFWAPWCTVCRGEAPSVSQVAEDLDGDVTFVGVAGLGETDAMEQFVDDTGVTGFEHVIDADGSIWNGFGVVSQPSYVFVDADGQTETVVGALGSEGLEDASRALIDS